MGLTPRLPPLETVFWREVHKKASHEVQILKRTTQDQVAESPIPSHTVVMADHGVHKLRNEQHQNWKMSQRGVVIPAGAYAPTLAEF